MPVRTTPLMLLLWLGVLAACASAQSSQAVGETVPADFTYPRVYQRRILEEVRAKRLAGRVTATRGDLINGKVLVEIVDNERTERRIDARFADAKGHFDFGSRKLGKRVWLRLSMPGFDTVFVPVRLGRKGSEALALEMPPST